MITSLLRRRCAIAVQPKLFRSPTPLRNKKEGPRCFSVGGSWEDPDEYRGPGGLTATEIFKKVQESAGKDKEYSESILDNLHKEFDAAEEARKRNEIRKSPSNMSVKELREVLDTHSVDHSDCFEKSDLIQRARGAMGKKK
mmetsp:Transcript_37039/g.80628  ORF Transcript_37039/g.80628 Transcript_37039/m.80628 type:complete len:141 (-) Transcript_37039:201-623(-)